jgi:hypothetical protein
MSESTEKPRTVRALFGHARRHLLPATQWLDYVQSVYEIDPGEHPRLSYVGVNFTQDAIKNYKFYFAFYRRLSSEEIQTALPVADRGRFDELYAEWAPNSVYEELHRGTTFALKIDRDGALTHYYHLRIPGLPFGPPERLTLRDSDYTNLHGACEEFTDSQIHLKRYYYFRDPATIAESLVLAGYSAFVDEVPSIDLLEYIESEGRDKMDWVSSSQHLIQGVIAQRGPSWLSTDLARICWDCGFELYGPGSARDGRDHSLYFVEPGKPMFDGVRRFLSRHLKIPGFAG